MPLAGIPPVVASGERDNELMLGLDDSFFGKCSPQRVSRWEESKSKQ